MLLQQKENYMFESFKKIYYSGIKGDIVRIPNKQRGEHVTDRTAELIKALAGKHPNQRDKNGYMPCNYFGLLPSKTKRSTRIRRVTPPRLTAMEAITSKATKLTMATIWRWKFALVRRKKSQRTRNPTSTDTYGQ